MSRREKAKELDQRRLPSQTTELTAQQTPDGTIKNEAKREETDVPMKLTKTGHLGH